jgi:D-glycero-D-manno-heptose 1,7-bisphosphate phosphatase
MKNKGLFLDRDGVINFDYGYVHKIKDFDFRPEIFEVCKTAMIFNYKIIVVTNQSGIGQKMFSIDDFKILNNHMLSIFMKNKIKITDVFYCPFHPTKGDGKYKKNSFYRKPNPGMILDASKKHLIDLDRSIMIGDKSIDYQAAKNSNIKHYIDANTKNWSIQSIKKLKEMH